MDKQLRKLYSSLPYILFKKKYLIPHPPKLHLFPNTSLKRNPYAMLEKYFPHAINDTTADMFKTSNHSQIQEIFHSQSQKALSQYHSAVDEYMKEYINPFKTIAKGIQPEIIYLRQNRSKIKEVMLLEGQTYPFSVLYKYFRQLPEEEKEKYREKANEVIQEHIKLYTTQAAKYMIPQKTYLHPNVLYLRETVNGPITSGMMGLFKGLPEQQKKIYRDKAAEMKKADLKNLEEFLARRNLSVSQFKVIKKVSEEFERAKSRLKQQKKDEKEKKLGIMDIFEQQHATQQDTKKPNQ